MTLLTDGTEPMIRREMEEFDFSNPPVNPMELANRLYDYMIENEGLGFSANQAGLPYRVFVMRSEPKYACFNPKIVHSSKETILLDEGCISFKGLIVKIKRPKSIRVRFSTPAGGVTTQQFTGMAARIFQHEKDHLDGIVFFDRATRYHRDQAMKNWERWKSKQSMIVKPKQPEPAKIEWV